MWVVSICRSSDLKAVKPALRCSTATSRLLGEMRLKKRLHEVIIYESQSVIDT